MAASAAMEDSSVLGLSSLGSIFAPGTAMTRSESTTRGPHHSQSSIGSSNTGRRIRKSQQSFIRNFLLSIATLPYYRVFRRNTLAPILRILDSKDDAQLLRRMRVWRDAKISELRFVQVAAAIVANGVIGCFSWASVEDDYWLGKACWYIGMLMAVAAVLLSSQQHVILEMGRLSQEDTEADGRADGASIVESEARAARRFLTLIAVHKDKISPFSASSVNAQPGTQQHLPRRPAGAQDNGDLEKAEQGIANASGISVHDHDHDHGTEQDNRSPATSQQHSTLHARSPQSSAATTPQQEPIPSPLAPIGIPAVPEQLQARRQTQDDGDRQPHHYHHHHSQRTSIARDFSPNWNMVYIWQSPMMLLTYSWISLLCGLTIHVCTPLIISGVRSGGDFNSAIFFLVIGSLSLLNFVWCSFWVYRYPIDDA